MKLSEAIEHFEQTHQPGLLSRNTLKANHIAYRYLLNFMDTNGRPDPEISDIKRDDILAFRGWLLERKQLRPGRRYPAQEENQIVKQRRQAGKLSLHSIHCHIRSVKRLFNFLISEGVIREQDSPILGVANVSLPAPSPRGIEIENAKKMLKLVQGMPLQRLYLVRDSAIAGLMMSKCGDFTIGSGELSRLEIGNISWDTLRLDKIEIIPRRREIALEYRMTLPQLQALYDWLAVRPACESPYVFVTLDPRGREGEGGAMANRAIYSAYHSWNRRTARDWAVYYQSLRQEEYYQTRRRAVLYFMADTGARSGGILGLTRDRLDLTRREAVVLEKGKTGGKHRPVFFSEVTAAALADWVAMSAADCGESVFGMTAQALNRVMSKLAEQAGVNAIHNPHSWRHAFARLALMQGGDLATVSQLMGHSSVNVTGNFYARFNTRELKAAHDRLSPLSVLLQMPSGYITAGE